LVEYVAGVIEIAVVFLSIVAGIIAATLFEASKKKQLLAWRPLIAVLILFAVEEILKALRSFGIWSTPHLTHIVPSFILGFLIWALVLQISIARGAK
jgi:hypothetical protein